MAKEKSFFGQFWGYMRSSWATQSGLSCMELQMRAGNCTIPEPINPQTIFRWQIKVWNASRKNQKFKTAYIWLIWLIKKNPKFIFEWSLGCGLPLYKRVIVYMNLHFMGFLGLKTFRWWNQVHSKTQAVHFIPKNLKNGYKHPSKMRKKATLLDTSQSGLKLGWFEAHWVGWKPKFLL